MNLSKLNFKKMALAYLVVSLSVWTSLSAVGVQAWEIKGAEEASTPTERKSWASLEEGSTAEGAVALENDFILLVVKPGASGPVLYSKGKNSEMTKVNLTFVKEDGSTSALKSAKLKSVAMDEGVIEVSSGDVSFELKVQIGQALVLVKSSKAGGFLELGANSRYAVRPGFNGDGIEDVVYDPTRLEKATVAVAAENFVLNCLEGNHALLMCVWPTKTPALADRAKVSLLLEGKGTERRIASTRIGFLEEAISVSILERQGIWFDQDVSAFEANRPVKVDWERPFEALWRANVLPKKNSTSGSQTFTFVNNPSAVIPASFKEKSTFLMMPGEDSKNPYSRALVYPVDRFGDKTPMLVYTPVDIMRASLGVGPCEYALDLESVQEEEPEPLADSSSAEILLSTASAEPMVLEGVSVPVDTAEKAGLREELKGQGYIYMPDMNKLFRLSPDGSDKKMIWEAANKKKYIAYTRVSWDGKWVAMVLLTTKNNKKNQEVWLMKHDGSEAKIVFKDENPGFRISCAWSPESTWLLISHGAKVDGLNLETREMKKVFEAESTARNGRKAGMTHLSSDKKGSFYFWNCKVKGGDAFTIDKDCNLVKPLYTCGMWTACEPSVSPDGYMVARHHHDYETNNGHKRGYVSYIPEGKKSKEFRFIPETKNFGYRGTHNMPFWSDDGKYIGYMYIPDAENLKKDGFSIPKNSGVLVVCRTRVGGGPMLWLTIGKDRMASCSWGPVPE